jgi:hypothetical protein
MSSKFIVGHPPDTHSNIFMPLITIAYLEKSGLDYKLSNELNDYKKDIITSFLKVIIIYMKK